MDRSGIDELSDRLAGQVIVVEPGPDKSDLEKIALGHGATVEQNAVKGRTTKYITVRICYDCTEPCYRNERYDSISRKPLDEIQKAFKTK